MRTLRIRPLALVLLLAAGLRAIPLLAVLANGGSPLIGDEGNYVEAALALARGAGIPDLWIWIRPPGYIAFAAAVFRLANNSLVALQIAQIGLSLVTVALTYVLVVLGLGTGDQGSAVRDQRSGISGQGSAVRDAGAAPTTGNPKSKIQNPKSVALLAAAILAVQPSLIFATGLFLTETLFLALLSGLIVALLAYRRAAPPRAAAWATVAGLLAGAALLTRASLIPLLGVALAALLWPTGRPVRHRLGAAGLFLGALLLLLAPWTIRNALHYGRFLPLDTAGYIAIWTGNTDTTLDELHEALYRLPNLADRGPYALGQAVAWAGAHPDRFLARAAGRVVDSVAPDDFTQSGFVARDKLPGQPCGERDAFSFLVWWGWVLLGGAGLAGWLGARRDILWWLAGGVGAVYLASIAITPNEFRYRYQLFSLLAIYAALALARLWRAVRAPRRPGRAWRLGLLPAAVFVAWLILVQPTFWPGFSRAVQAQEALGAAATARAAGDLAGAQQDDATGAELERTCAAVRRDLGAVQLQQGQLQPAAATWADALDQEPGDWRTRALLADLWRRLGQPRRSAAVTRDVPPTFNGIMLAWAWDHLGARAPLTLTAGLDDVGLVRGFQIGEAEPGGRLYRWAGPAADSSIRLRGGQPAGARLTLVLLGLPQAAPAPPARPVRVAANGHPLGTIQVAPGWAPYAFDLPAAWTAGAPDIVLSFSAPPQQASAQDPRYLSFALNTATIRPAP